MGQASVKENNNLSGRLCHVFLQKDEVNGIIFLPFLVSFLVPSFFVFSSSSSLLSCNRCRLLSLSFGHHKRNCKYWPGTQELLRCHKHRLAGKDAHVHTLQVCPLFSLQCVCVCVCGICPAVANLSLETEVFAFSLYAEFSLPGEHFCVQLI